MNKKAEKFLLSLVKNNYDDIADNFAETRKKPMKPMVYDIVNNIKINDGARILDLGCGNGRFVEVLFTTKQNNIFYLGLDGSKRLIDFAKERYSRPQNNFLQFDLLELSNLKESNFNYIFSWAALHHIPGKNLRLNFFNNVYDKLVDDGTFVFSVWKLRQKNNFLRLAFWSFFTNIIKGRIIDLADLIFPWRGKSNLTHNNKEAHKSLRYYHAFSKKQLIRLIKKTKFCLNSSLEDDFNYYFILKK